MTPDRPPKGPRDGSPTDDPDQQRRNTTAVAAYGRLLTGAHTPEDPTAGDPTADPTGAVHVCGIGLIPIAVALAAVPVDDARQRLLLDPDNQDARDDEQRALARLREVTAHTAGAARARGDEEPAPPR